MPRRRITARDMDQQARIERDGHLYFHTHDHGSGPYHRGRCLLVFLCPSEGPTTPEHWSILRRVMQGHGIALYGVVYLFTDTALRPEDLKRADAPVGPLADSSLSAGLRWVEDAWRPRGGDGKPGRVVLCYGRPFKSGGVADDMLREREAVLWSALRTFKRRVSCTGRTPDFPGHNPLTAKTGATAGTGAVWEAPDGGPLPRNGCTGWWSLNPR